MILVLDDRCVYVKRQVLFQTLFHDLQIRTVAGSDTTRYDTGCSFIQ